MSSFTRARGWRTFMVLIMALSLMLIFPNKQALATDVTHQVTNAGDKSFTIAWITEAAEIGYVNYGTSAGSLVSTACDERVAQVHTAEAAAPGSSPLHSRQS